MRRIKIILVVLCMSLMVLGMVSGASALPISLTPADALPIPISDNSNLSGAQIASLLGVQDLYLYYKQDVGALTDTGPFASFYETTFFPTSNPSGATITYLPGGAYITGTPLYMYVKDGNHVPAAYLFQLTWNGMDTIELVGFWPDGGAISNLAIYGTAPAPVPEPSTLLLLGSGLVGLAGARRRLRK